MENVRGEFEGVHFIGFATKIDYFIDLNVVLRCKMLWHKKYMITFSIIWNKPKHTTCRSQSLFIEFPH